jgi:hypothetical protein
MEKLSLDAIARTQARLAAAAPSGRSAGTVYGGHEYARRQTVLARTPANPAPPGRLALSGLRQCWSGAPPAAGGGAGAGGLAPGP